MTRKILTPFVVFLISSLLSIGVAQDGDAGYQGLKFSAQPKHQSELGVSLGHFMVVGDVTPRPGWGVGVHFRRAFDYAFSWRLDLMYGQARGLERRNGTGHANANPVLNQNGLGYGTASGNPWYANYQTKYMSATLQGIWSLNSFNFKQQIKKFNWYLLGGVGLDSYEAFYDALNGNTVYDFRNIDQGLNPENSRDDRKEVRDRLKDLLDGDYETRAEIASGRRPGDDPENRQFNFHAQIGVGLAIRISEKINIGIEHQATVVFGNEGDLLDGYRWRTPDDLTQYRDLVNYTNVRLNFNLGKGDDRSAPLWWVSPLDLIAEDLAEVKARPVLDLTDTDNDGVIDMIDQEKDTKEGCPTDTRGIILDSDADGIPDCEDDEPYSPPGYKVDTKGIAQVPDPGYVNEEGVNKIVDAKMAEMNATLDNLKTDWFLPMIHFGLDKYSIKNSEYGKLHNVATVMKQHPSTKVVVTGYTDRLAGDCYNDVLSFNRATAAIEFLVAKYNIPRDRFVLMYGGKNSTLVPTDGANMMNRRVEFAIAEGGESEMARPDCGVKNAGSGGSKYSGNKEAGY